VPGCGAGASERRHPFRPPPRWRRACVTCGPGSLRGALGRAGQRSSVGGCSSGGALGRRRVGERRVSRCRRGRGWNARAAGRPGRGAVGRGSDPVTRRRDAIASGPRHAAAPARDDGGVRGRPHRNGGGPRRCSRSRCVLVDADGSRCAGRADGYGCCGVRRRHCGCRGAARRSREPAGAGRRGRCRCDHCRRHRHRGGDLAPSDLRCGSDLVPGPGAAPARGCHCIDRSRPCRAPDAQQRGVPESGPHPRHGAAAALSQARALRLIDDRRRHCGRNKRRGSLVHLQRCRCRRRTGSAAGGRRPSRRDHPRGRHTLGNFRRSRGGRRNGRPSTGCKHALDALGARPRPDPGAGITADPRGDDGDPRCRRPGRVVRAPEPTFECRPDPRSRVARRRRRSGADRG